MERFFEIIVKGEEMLIIYSDKIVLQDSIQEGYIKVEGNIIKAITTSISKDEEKFVLDCKGSYIMPGIINISSNNIERKEIAKMSTAQVLNKLRVIEYAYASSGVSTIYHSLYLTEKKIKNLEEEKQKTIEIINNIKNYDEHPVSLIDNKTHLKFQINSIKTIDDVKYLLDEKLLDFVSYEIKTKDKSDKIYKDQYMQSFIQTNLNLSEEMSNKVIDRIRQLREEANIDELAYLIKYAHFKGIKVATSEYSSANKIYNEFKDTTDIIKITGEKDAAQIEKDVFFKLINVARLLENNDYSVIDDDTIISSDKSPNDYILLMDELSKTMPINEISKLLSKNPALALGIENKGEIKEGYVADLIVVKKFDNKEMVVVNMIKDGQIKFTINI